MFTAEVFCRLQECVVNDTSSSEFLGPLKNVHIMSATKMLDRLKDCLLHHPSTVEILIPV